MNVTFQVHLMRTHSTSYRYSYMQQALESMDVYLSE